VENTDDFAEGFVAGVHAILDSGAGKGNIDRDLAEVIRFRRQMNGSRT
jgi:hypothetical protein